MQPPKQSVQTEVRSGGPPQRFLIFLERKPKSWQWSTWPKGLSLPQDLWPPFISLVPSCPPYSTTPTFLPRPWHQLSSLHPTFSPQTAGFMPPLPSSVYSNVTFFVRPNLAASTENYNPLLWKAPRSPTPFNSLHHVTYCCLTYIQTLNVLVPTSGEKCLVFASLLTYPSLRGPSPTLK